VENCFFFTTGRVVVLGFEFELVKKVDLTVTRMKVSFMDDLRNHIGCVA